MLSASLIGLLVSLTAFTAPASSLPISEIIRGPGHDTALEHRALETEYTPLPNRPTAAHLPKRTAMGPTRTELHITTTAKPVDKRAGMDPGAYLTSFDSLWSAYGESPDSSRFTALSGFIENHQPTGMDTTAFKASITSMLRGAGENVADVFSAVGSGIGDLFGGNGSANSTSPAGVISTSGGTTYWSLPNYVSTWTGMNVSAQDSWRISNNYVGTFTDTEAATFSSGVKATVLSLATVDSGMAQVSWTKNNVWSGFDRTTSNIVTDAGGVSGAGVAAQMNTVAGAHSSPTPASVQSGNAVVSQNSTAGGSNTVNSQLITNVMAGNDGVTTNNVIPQYTTNQAGVTIIASSQQTAGSAVATGLAPGILASCPTLTGANGVYVACNRGEDPALAIATTSSPVASAGGTGPAAGQNSLPASSNCTLAACTAMKAPYSSPVVTST